MTRWSLVCAIMLLVMSCEAFSQTPRKFEHVYWEGSVWSNGVFLSAAYPSRESATSWTILIARDGTYTLEVGWDLGVRGQLRAKDVQALKQLIAAEDFATLPAEDHGPGPQRILDIHLNGLVRNVYSCYITPQTESQHHFDRIWAFVTSLVPPPTAAEMDAVHSQLANEKAQQAQQVIDGIEAQKQALQQLVLPARDALPKLDLSEDALVSLLPRESEVVMAAKPSSAAVHNSPARIVVEMMTNLSDELTVPAVNVVIGARHLALPLGLGIGHYDGSTLILFDHPPDTASSLGKLPSVKTSGYTIYYEETKFSDHFRALRFFTFPYPNVMVLAQDTESLRETLERMNRGQISEGPPPSLQRSWATIDRASPFWAVRDMTQQPFDTVWNNLRGRKLSAAPHYQTVTWNVDSSPVCSYFGCSPQTLADCDQARLLLTFKVIEPTTLQATVTAPTSTTLMGYGGDTKVYYAWVMWHSLGFTIFV